MVMAVSQSQKTVVSIIFAIPALLFGIYTYLMSHGEYYFYSYLAVSLAFIIFSLIFGWHTPKVLRKKTYPGKSIIIFLRGSAAWIFSLLVLTLLNFTPLCVGQNNGDGSNDAGLCFFYALLSSFFYSLLVVPLIALNSYLISKIVKA